MPTIFRSSQIISSYDFNAFTIDSRLIFCKRVSHGSIWPLDVWSFHVSPRHLLQHMASQISGISIVYFWKFGKFKSPVFLVIWTSGHCEARSPGYFGHGMGHYGLIRAAPRAFQGFRSQRSLRSMPQWTIQPKALAMAASFQWCAFLRSRKAIYAICKCTTDGLQKYRNISE